MESETFFYPSSVLGLRCFSIRPSLHPAFEFDAQIIQLRSPAARRPGKFNFRKANF